VQTISVEWFLLGAAVLMIGSVLAGSLSTRFGVPALIAFLALGMLAGSDGLGGIAFEDYSLSQAVGVTALVLILFAGGLASPWTSLRSVLRPALVLSTLGVAISAAIIAAVARWLLQFSWPDGLLLGAIVASTDAAAVFACLGGQDGVLRHDVRALLEVESGANDPVAVFLVIACIAVLKHPGLPLAGFALQFVDEMLGGLVIGLAVGAGFVVAIRRVKLAQVELHVVVTTAAALLAYGAAAVVGASGFLAVFVAAVVAASRAFPFKESLTRFHEALAWLAQVCMFLTLGLLVFPSRLPAVAVPGLVIAAALIFIARPVAVFVCLAPFRRIGWQAKLFISWCGLRGAAPIVLATFPMLAGAPHAGTLFNVVFFVVLVSSLVQGPLIPWIGRRLGLYEHLAAVQAPSARPGMA
jgi:cell volume regulation protein A